MRLFWSIMSGIVVALAPYIASLRPGEQIGTGDILQEWEARG